MARVAHTISKSRHRKPIAAINQKKVLESKLRAELNRFFGCFEVICLLATVINALCIVASLSG